MDKAIIVDLDGTLCNIEHRKKYIDGSLGKKDWDKFYEGIIYDSKHEWCERIVSLFAKYSCEDFEENHIVLFVTGRPEKCREDTLKWFSRFYICTSSVAQFELFMRKDDDYRPDHVIKKEIYENHIKDKYDVLFAIEDRKKVVDMWREQGIVCLQCDEGNF